VEEIVPISARLVINQAALKLKRETIQPMLEAFSAASMQRSASQELPEAAHQ
jgi:ATP phosphoribosyltransferase